MDPEIEEGGEGHSVEPSACAVGCAHSAHHSIGGSVIMLPQEM